MENRIKKALSNMSENEELSFIESGIDISCKVDRKTSEKIKKSVLKKLGKDERERPYRFSVSYAAKAALCIILVAVAAITTVCAVNEGTRDKIIKVFSGAPKAEETAYETSGYESVKYEVAEQVDFSAFDYSRVDRIFIKCGYNGEEAVFYDVDDIISKVKELKCHTPKTSVGRYGYSYYIRMYSGDSVICRLAVLWYKGAECLEVFYGLYEKVGTFDYSVVYLSDNDGEAFTDFFDELMGDED